MIGKAVCVSSDADINHRVWPCPPWHRTGITMCFWPRVAHLGCEKCVLLCYTIVTYVIALCSRVAFMFQGADSFFLEVFFPSEWEQFINDSVIVVSNVALSVGKLCQGLQRTFLSHKVCLSRCCWDFWHPFWPPFSLLEPIVWLSPWIRVLFSRGFSRWGRKKMISRVKVLSLLMSGGKGQLDVYLTQMLQSLVKICLSD